MRIKLAFLAILVSGSALASSISVGVGTASVVLATRQNLTSQNYYISTAGDDSQTCGLTSKCRTLAHVLSLLPLVLDRPYIINVADGTYAEVIDTTGFRGTGLLGGTYAVSITILGNVSTPANVVFNTVGPCVNYFGTGTANAGACISGSAKVVLKGLTITNGDVFGIACWGGVMELNTVVVTLTGGPIMPNGSFGIDNLECHWLFTGDVTVSGFDTGSAPVGGLGIYNAHGTIGVQTTGTVTIIGPAAGADYHGTAGLVIEYGNSAYTIVDTGSMTINGVQTAILVNDNGVLTDYATGGTFTLRNSTTATGSTAIDVHGGGTVNLGNYGAGAGPALSIDKWTKCFFAGELSVIDHQGTRSTTNCTVSTTSGGGQILLF